MTEQQQIAVLMRAGELTRRDERRKRLQQELASLKLRFRNEGLLLNEELTSEDVAAHAEATARMREQQLRFEKETRPSYWRRLWAAILGR